MRVNESGVDLDVKNTVNTVDASNILLKSLIIKVNEGDSDESSEDINDDSYFDSSNDDNVLISTMYETEMKLCGCKTQVNCQRDAEMLKPLYSSAVGLNDLLSMKLIMLLMFS